MVGKNLAVFCKIKILHLGCQVFFVSKNVLPKSEQIRKHFPNIPMISNANDVESASQLKGKSYEALLTFNEPDSLDPDEPKMSVDQALNEVIMDQIFFHCSKKKAHSTRSIQKKNFSQIIGHN